METKSLPAREWPFGANYDGRPFTTCKYGFRTLCMKPVAKVKEGMPGVAFPDFSDQVDIQAVVDSYKEETGLAYALRQINSGRLLPTTLNDKGTGSVDLSQVPDNVNDAHRAALAAGAQAQAVADSLGIPNVDSRKIEQIVTDAINKKVTELKAAQAVQQTKKEGE